mmetsp:Transcript_8415/g.25963  ORF Transcript_8415/g.25963 Transcript_8415/m.25963 type:complete len:242 (+) Transcript_8415:36-761(+)
MCADGSLRGEEQLPDGGFVLLHDQLQPQVDGVVDGDLAVLAEQHDAAEARRALLALHGCRRQERLAVDAELARLAGAGLGLDHLRVLLRGRLQAGLHQLLVARAAADDDLGLQQHQQALDDELCHEGLAAVRALHLLQELALHVLRDHAHHLLTRLDLLQALLVDGHGPRDGVLRLDLLHLAAVLHTDLLLGLVHDLQLLNAELLERLRGDLLGLVLGLVQDELDHLADLVLGLRGRVHGC